MRLKVGVPALTDMNPNGFQFQTGAIKRIASARSDNLIVMFQFQTGAIKSPTAAESRAPTVSCFNSKLVRLKAEEDFGLSEKVLSVSIPNWCD